MVGSGFRRKQNNKITSWPRETTNFAFLAVTPADAEKLTDMNIKKATIQGNVKEVSLESLFNASDSSPPYCITLTLADVQVNGKALTPSRASDEKGKGGKGKG